MTFRLARMLFTAVVAALFTLAATSGPAAAAPAPAPAPAPSDTNYSEARILWLMNEERRVHGLPPVVRHGSADGVAQYSADIQAWVNRLGHNPNLGKDITARVTSGWHFAAENVGCAADADTLHGLWMRSASHRSNLLAAGVDTVGIGTVYARGCLWATVVFVDT